MVERFTSVSEDELCEKCIIKQLLNWVIPEKIHTPRRMANWKFSQEGGLIAQEIRAGGGSEAKNSSSGVTFNFNLDRYISTT